MAVVKANHRTTNTFRTQQMKFKIADLFCGAGGTSEGAMEAAEFYGRKPELTAINHWPVAINTHETNHPAARSLCTGVDAVNPRDLFGEGELDMLWASPECTHHSVARGGKPINDQSRATAWCVVRWAEALRPPVILVENVPEFQTWGPIGSNNQPLKSKKGETFQAWLAALRSLGYKTDYRLLCAADYGDPTTRTRLFVQAVRGRRKIVWPEPTHSELPDIMVRRRWSTIESGVIDWSIEAPLLTERKRMLAPRTINRINEGFAKYGAPFLIAMEHGGRVIPATSPMPTVTTAKGGAFALVVEYYGNGRAIPVSRPLPTVTCKDRFGLVTINSGLVGFRMLKPHEYASAQGFPRGYQFTGTKTEQVKQIGNAVPRRLARAIVAASISQNADVSALVTAEEASDRNFMLAAG
jgi:DNA (cytosine-5)-methyltransferase 1